MLARLSIPVQRSALCNNPMEREIACNLDQKFAALQHLRGDRGVETHIAYLGRVSPFFLRLKNVVFFCLSQRANFLSIILQDIADLLYYSTSEF